jgi:osmotically-inducible protein OsmY
MNISKVLVALVLAMAVVGSSCSSKDKDQAREAVQKLEDKTKEAADDAAQKTKEVAADVANKGKEVVSATGEAITDGWITAKVKAKFADDKELKSNTINVDTSDRVVKLKGTVVSEVAKKRAVMIAGGTEGVLRVVDELSVKAK